MAKRRNLKKEKAHRNQAYARQFRKRTSRSYSRNNPFSNRNRHDSDNNESDSNSNGDRDKETTENRDRSSPNR